MNRTTSFECLDENRVVLLDDFDRDALTWDIVWTS